MFRLPQRPTRPTRQRVGQRRTVEQRWSLVALVFTVVIIVLLVGLSLWIMYYVHYNMLGL
ncbi:hypothetical protein J3B00_002845 [Pseudomonas sp. BP8]|nr:hypothetical protein [Pseudomonas sp. BP8]